MYYLRTLVNLDWIDTLVFGPQGRGRADRFLTSRLIHTDDTSWICWREPPALPPHYRLLTWARSKMQSPLQVQEHHALLPGLIEDPDDLLNGQSEGAVICPHNHHSKLGFFSWVLIQCMATFSSFLSSPSPKSGPLRPKPKPKAVQNPNPSPIGTGVTQ